MAFKFYVVNYYQKNVLFKRNVLCMQIVSLAYVVVEYQNILLNKNSMPQKLATNFGTEKFHGTCRKKFHTTENFPKQRLWWTALQRILIGMACGSIRNHGYQRLYKFLVPFLV